MGGSGIKQVFWTGGTMRCDYCGGTGRVITAITEEIPDNPWLDPSRHSPSMTGGVAPPASDFECRFLNGWFAQQFAAGIRPPGFGGKE